MSPTPAMADPAVQPPLLAAMLALAAAALLWQFRHARRARRGVGDPRQFPRPLFWMGMAAWVVAGFLLGGGAWPQLPSAYRWLIPLLGLGTLAAAHWIAGTQLRDPPAATAIGGELPGNGGDVAAEDLDADDVRLLHRLTALLGRRAAGLMVPTNEVHCVTGAAALEEVLKILAAARALRIPVLDDTRTRALGVIDGRDLLERLHAGEGSARAATARDLCKPLPTVAARESADRALESLRKGGTGVAAVVDLRGRVLGFLAWQPIFRALLGRQVRGGAL